jgi:hypothetical protein
MSSLREALGIWECPVCKHLNLNDPLIIEVVCEKCESPFSISLEEVPANGDETDQL